MLTKKQRELLLYIHEHMSDDDIAPSFEEMKDALGLKSKSGIHRLISGLVERGYLERLPHRARALSITKLPEGFKGESQRSDSSQGISHMPANMMEVPIFGKIAAGTPIEAIQNEGAGVFVPPEMLSKGGEHYALTVSGDSMVNAGIHDRDTVIIQRCNTAENGEIIVALVDDQEATLKRLRRAGAKIVLEPENDDYEPQILDPERVKIQGRLISLMRSYH